MAFVNEIIPEDAKTGFTFPVKTLSDGTRPTLWKWTIDKERDIALLTTDKEGGAYEGTNETRSFMLLSRGLQIPFIGECRNISKSTTEVEVEWQVRNVNGGQNSVLQTPEVQKSITDALNAMGWLYSTTNVEKASVTFGINNLENASNRNAQSGHKPQLAIQLFSYSANHKRKELQRKS